MLMLLVITADQSYDTAASILACGNLLFTVLSFSFGKIDAPIEIYLVTFCNPFKQYAHKFRHE